MKTMSLLPLTILLFTAGCLGPGDGPPPPDDCSNPSALDGIDTIEVGAMQDGAFVPWQDGEVVDLTYGSQGGAMIGVALSLRGSDLPRCMPHTIDLIGQDGRLAASSDYPVRTYSGSDGTRNTATIWMVFPGQDPLPGEQLELELHVGSFEIRRSLLIEGGPVPAGLRILDDAVLYAGGQYMLEIWFDGWNDWGTVVTIESSDPEVVRPLSPMVEIVPSYSNVGFADIEALAPGGPVTLSVTANGKTVSLQVAVLEGPTAP